MKVAQVCHLFHPYVGGIETHVYEISKRLAKEMDVEVLTTDPGSNLPREEKIDGVLIRRFKAFAPSNSYYFSYELYAYLKKHSSDYDIVHAHNYHAFPALFAALTKQKNKLVFTPHYHGGGHSFFRNILHKPYKSLGKKIFEEAEAVVCVSRYEKKLLLSHFEIEESKISVIPNGVNVKEFRKIKRRRNNKSILYVGRIEKYKGVEHVVKALKYLPEYRLEIVGEGSYKRKIIKLARKIGVLSRINFCGKISGKELIRKYAEAGILVLLSKHEAYGLAIAEALAAGIPCIVSATSALDEWVDNEKVFSAGYPINIEKLVNLVVRLSKIKINKVALLSLEEVSRRIIKIYNSI